MVPFRCLVGILGSGALWGQACEGSRRKEAFLLLVGMGFPILFYLGSDRPEGAVQWIQAAMAKRKGET
jgi:hypothetical protein